MVVLLFWFLYEQRLFLESNTFTFIFNVVSPTLPKNKLCLDINLKKIIKKSTQPQQLVLFVLWEIKDLLRRLKNPARPKASLWVYIFYLMSSGLKTCVLLPYVCTRRPHTKWGVCLWQMRLFSLNLITCTLFSFWIIPIHRKNCM